jgi:uncharacterized membrane protein YkvA (DUF1232 family)
MRNARDWLRKVPQRINTSARWLITKARNTSKATRISIGIALIILYWLMPAKAVYHQVPEVDPSLLASAVILLVGGTYLIDGRYRR